MEQREILFRAKSTHSNEWVYGTYHYCTKEGLMRFVDYKNGNRIVEDRPQQFNSHWILEHRTPDSPGWDVRETFLPISVIPETVGQFCNLVDMFENKIFYGDIVLYANSEKMLVYWRNGEWHFKRIQVDGKDWIEVDTTEIKIIGNKWDNAELLNAL